MKLFPIFLRGETLAPRTNSLAPETVGGSSEDECGHLGTRLLQHQVNSCELHYGKGFLKKLN